MATEPLRILKLLATSRLGGTEMSVLRLVKRMDRRRFHVEAAFLEGPGPLTGMFEDEGVPVHHVPSGPAAVSRLARLMREGSFSIAAAYGFKAGLIARLAGLFAPCMVVCGLRSVKLTDARGEGSPKEALALILDRLSFPLAAAYVSNTRAAAERLLALGYPEHKVFVVQGGIEPSESQPAPADLGPPNPRAPVVTCLGNLKPVKDHETLIAAAARLKEMGVEYNLVLVGEGPLKKRLKGMASSLGVEDSILFLGARGDVDEILAASDVFVLSSLWEGLPVSVMEAMARGLPVAATDSGGTGELLSGARTLSRGIRLYREGFLVPPRSPGALAGALALLLEDESLRETMGRAGKKRVTESFNAGKAARETEALYLELFERWPKRR